MKLNQMIDHTLLKVTATEPEYSKLVDDALEFQFKAVCVPPIMVKYCKERLDSSDVLIASVVGFPSGYSLTSTKVEESKNLIQLGADEIDFVTNIGWVKSSKFDLILEEYKAIKDACDGKTTKAILETGALTESEIKKLCDLAIKAKLDFIKTSTGFYEIGARLSDVQLMRRHVGQALLIKASGGIKDFQTAKQFINAGADRLGCSASVNILISSQTE